MSGTFQNHRGICLSAPASNIRVCGIVRRRSWDDGGHGGESYVFGHLQCRSGIDKMHNCMFESNWWEDWQVMMGSWERSELERLDFWEQTGKRVSQKEKGKKCIIIIYGVPLYSNQPALYGY